MMQDIIAGVVTGVLLGSQVQIVYKSQYAMFYNLGALIGVIVLRLTVGTHFLGNQHIWWFWASWVVTWVLTIALIGMVESKRRH